MAEEVGEKEGIHYCAGELGYTYENFTTMLSVFLRNEKIAHRSVSLFCAH